MLLIIDYVLYLKYDLKSLTISLFLFLTLMLIPYFISYNVVSVTVLYPNISSGRVNSNILLWFEMSNYTVCHRRNTNFFVISSYLCT